MLVLVRHGDTEMNENGNGNERTRGWLPVPLTLDGMNAITQTADDLSSLEDVKTLYCSDLIRSVQSAEEVAHALQMTIQPTESLRDWNIGEYAGQEVGKILKDLHSYMDDPMKTIPGGESYQQFLDRATSFIKPLVESNDLYVAVTHNRVLTLVSALCKNKGEYPAMSVLKAKGPVPPAGILIVNPDWKILYASAKNE